MPRAPRPATPDDVDGLVGLVRAAYRGPESLAGWGQEAELVAGTRIDAAELRASLADSAVIVLVVDADPTPAGPGARPLACCRLRAGGEAGVAELGMLAVDPVRQAAGVGRELLAAARGIVRERFAARTLEIEVLAQQARLVAWYERRGFRATGEIRPFPADPVRARPLVDGLHFLVMRAPVDPGPVALSWSGGKDSALALAALDGPPVALITTVTRPYARVSMHGVRTELASAQARALDVPLITVEIAAGATNDAYEDAWRTALTHPSLTEVTEIAFGDLFLVDVRTYRERLTAETERRATFPLWGLDTATLARRFIADGFRATVVCVDPRRVDPAIAGRPYDEALLDALPAGVDPCGERGEFHTFVHDGPGFATPVAVAPGEVVERDGFVFADLLAA